MKALVLILDSLPPGFLGCYGNDWIDTPALDRIAAEGVVFDRHYSDCPDAASARRAWESGRYTFPLSNEMAVEQPPAELIRLLKATSVRQFHITLGHNDAPEAFEATLDGVAGADRWLLWVELSTLLPPWDVPDDLFSRYFTRSEEDIEHTPQVNAFTELPARGLAPDDDEGFLRLQSTYGALVAQLDERIQDVVAELGRRKLLDEIMLIVTSDRGMALGEHGIVGDARPWLHSELVHLPLLVRWPHGAEAGRRVLALTQPVDLAPTILAAFGIPALNRHGHDLLPFLKTDADPVREFVCSGLRRGQALEWSLRSLNWSFLLPVSADPDDAFRGPQLYVQPDDRWEMNNVIQHHPELAEELERKLREFIRAPR
jgi:arylsulfatase A-like enzyme